MNGILGKRKIYLGHFALALGGFAMGTSDFMTGGLLPEMAKTTSVDIPTAGHYIANYAIGVLIGGPLLALFTSKLNRKTLLLALLMFYSLFNCLCMFANTYSGLAYLRLFAGLPHGIYFGVACVVAAAMVEEQDRPRAVANVVLGVTIASLVGVPIAIFIGQNFGWQMAYLLITILTLSSLLLIKVIVPKALNISKSTPMKELKILKRGSVLCLLAFVAVESAGLPSILSYLKVILIEEAGFSLEDIPFIMPLVGFGMLFANIIGPKMTGAFGPYRTLFLVMLASFTVYVSFYFVCHNKIGVLISCFFLGISFAAFPAIQTRMLAIARDGQTLGSALIQSAFYTANAMGAYSGGHLIALHYPYGNIPLLAAAFSVAGMLLFLCFCFFERKQKRLLHRTIFS